LYHSVQEEFLHSYKKKIGVRLISDMSPKQVSEYAIEVAKLHVEAALKEASEKAYFRDSNGFVCTTEENKKSILNSYPLENII
jgi:hypothetical protein